MARVAIVLKRLWLLEPHPAGLAQENRDRTLSRAPAEAHVFHPHLVYPQIDAPEREAFGLPDRDIEGVPPFGHLAAVDDAPGDDRFEDQRPEEPAVRRAQRDPEEARAVWDVRHAVARHPAEARPILGSLESVESLFRRHSGGARVRRCRLSETDQQ